MYPSLTERTSTYREDFSAPRCRRLSVWGHDQIVQRMLENEADVNAQRKYFGATLQAASCGGHDQIVQRLLENGADVNTQGGFFGTALQAASAEDHAASYKGHDEVVQRLLEKGANANAQGGSGTALQATSVNGLGAGMSIPNAALQKVRELVFPCVMLSQLTFCRSCYRRSKVKRFSHSSKSVRHAEINLKKRDARLNDLTSKELSQLARPAKLYEVKSLCKSKSPIRRCLRKNITITSGNQVVKDSVVRDRLGTVVLSRFHQLRAVFA
jgi:ankyrin repeat protein